MSLDDPSSSHELPFFLSKTLHPNLPLEQNFQVTHQQLSQFDPAQGAMVVSHLNSLERCLDEELHQEGMVVEEGTYI